MKTYGTSADVRFPLVDRADIATTRELNDRDKKPNSIAIPIFAAFKVSFGIVGVSYILFDYQSRLNSFIVGNTTSISTHSLGMIFQLIAPIVLGAFTVGMMYERNQKRE